MERPIKNAAMEIVQSKKSTIALTGAGISIASGIPAFRGSGGLWEKYDPDEYATIESFYRDPAKVWQMFKEFNEVIQNARPNPAHLALARLEELGYLSSVITQNVDGLHQEAGNKDVIEFHGNNRWVICLKCYNRYPSKELSMESLPPYCKCGGVLKPDAVFFGETIPYDALSRSQAEAQSCRVVLVIGTSAIVQPAASIPYIAKRAGAKVIEINPERALSSDIFLQGQAEEIMPLLVDGVIQLSSK